VCIDCEYGLSDRHPCVWQWQTYTHSRRSTLWMSIFFWLTHTLSQFPLKLPHPPTPPNPETQMPRYKFKFNHNLNLNLYSDIPGDPSFSIWWIFGGVAISVGTVIPVCHTCVYRLCVWTEWQASMCDNGRRTHTQKGRLRVCQKTLDLHFTLPF